MRIQLISMAVLIGCQVDAGDTDREDPGQVDETATVAVTDHLKEIFDQVDGARLTQVMRELSGVVPVTVNGVSITLGQRFDAAGRKRFRDYWTQTMLGLGLEVTQLHYQAAGHPRAGDNIEAVLRGPSPNSVVVIVHYDSIGPRGRETSNPGADDDMSGMAIQHVPRIRYLQLRQRRRPELQLRGARRPVRRRGHRVLVAPRDARLPGRQQRPLRDVGDRCTRAGVLRAQPVRESTLRSGRWRHLREDRHRLPDLDRTTGDHVPGLARRHPEVTPAQRSALARPR